MTAKVSQTRECTIFRHPRPQKDDSKDSTVAENGAFAVESGDDWHSGCGSWPDPSRSIQPNAPYGNTENRAAKDGAFALQAILIGRH